MMDDLPGMWHASDLSGGWADTEDSIVRPPHSLVDRLHEAGCCAEANGVSHGYAPLEGVVKAWIGERLDDPRTHRLLSKTFTTHEVTFALKEVFGVPA